MILALLLTLTLPNPTLTPGAVRPVTLADICPHAHTAAVRKGLTAATKRAVFARYALRSTPGRYEVDHLISLELGGSNDVTNLWPQRYHGRFNAHDKDALENQLHALVCAGTLALAEAQRAIAVNWVQALHTYGGKVGPR